MMNKVLNKIHILTLLIISQALPCLSQTTLPSQVKVYRPAELSQNIVRESEINQLVKSGNWGQKKSPNNPKHWVVFSDRENNTTYTKPSSSATALDKLKFNEKLRIADIQDGYALVYTEPKAGVQYPQISEMAKSRGWVPMSNLLLWESCPVNERDIYQKALLVANLDNAGQTNVDMGNYFSNPETKSVIGNITTDMTFYFVMKTDPKSNLVLLSRQSTLAGATDQMLFGWVNKNSFTPWNQRSCLEPNWDQDEVAYLNSPSGKKYNFYSDPGLKSVVSSYQYGVRNPNDNNSNTYYRMDPYMTRFPILDNDTKNQAIYKCTSFGNSGRSVINNPTGNGGKGKRKLEELTNMLENINLIFVIDGTSSMGPYFSSVKKAISRSIDYFDKNQYNVKAAVVIYRDYADGNALVEIQPLVSTNDKKLSKFLDEVGNLGYGPKSSPNDHTHTEALYKGLETALNSSKIGYKPDHANMMIVIGDCGNALNDAKALGEETLIEKLVENNIHLMSFQVDNRADEPWQLFNSQMSKLIQRNITDQYKKRSIAAKVKFKPHKLGYDIDNGGDEQLFVGSVRFEDEGKEMKADDLSRLIENNIGKFSEAIKRQITILQVGFEQGGDVKLNEMDRQFLISKIGKDLAKELMDKNITIATTSYVPKKDSSGRDYWKPIVFLSTAELDNLLERLSKVYDEANAVKNDNNRKPYIDAVKALLRAMVPDITDAEMDQKGIADVMNMIAGLNVTSDALNYSLLDLQDVHKVSHDKFQSLINDFCDKYERVRRIRKSNYTYAFEKNGTKYYWIPVEDLP